VSTVSLESLSAESQTGYGTLTIVEYALRRQVENEAAERYGNSTARMVWMPPRFQPNGLVAGKVAS